ncbi:MAG TPA: hypothetical protein VK109_03360, partial [Enterococcus sp.]|nr:hypothetical protein [Enterococcus sp.]
VNASFLAIVACFQLYHLNPLLNNEMFLIKLVLFSYFQFDIDKSLILFSKTFFTRLPDITKCATFYESYKKLL